MFRFIHAADLHIDSPLRGLERYDGAPVEQLRNATRQSLDKIVELAIEEQVQFVVIAGDLFDGQWTDSATGLWTASRFRQLGQHQIPVFLIRGNHDAAGRLTEVVPWPDNVHEFSCGQPGTVRIENLNVAVHGMGFANQKCDIDLAGQYPDAVSGCFNIGILHTSLSGHVDHHPYAPTSIPVLMSRGYDYWALGHVHERSQTPLREVPWIGWSGNTQGRNIRETGPRGCFLVSVDHSEVTQVEFRPTDTVRWHRSEIVADAADTREVLIQKAMAAIDGCINSSDGRFAAVRIVIRGMCAAHKSLVDASDRESFINELRSRACDLNEQAWLEKVRIETRPSIDIDQLRDGSDLVGDMLRDILALQQDDDELRMLAKELAPLLERAGGELAEIGIAIDKPEQISDWLKEAETLLVTHLMETAE